METLLKNVLKTTPFYRPLKNWAVKRQHQRELGAWDGGAAPPPHLIKQRTLRSYAQRYGLKILVETGTYYGDMVEAMKKDFDQIYSIELSRELYELAKKRFAGDKHVELIQGDSATELRSLIGRIDRPALFWLDGHYSAGVTARGEKDTPIWEELEIVFKAHDRRHVIIIDDARCFGTDPAYPSLEELVAFTKSKKPDADIKVEHDSIRITPRG